MNYTFGRVAAFCGLRLSYYSTAALLAITFLLLSLTEYRNPTPLYILLMLAVLPSLLKAMFFSGKALQKKESHLEYPLFCKKYGYDGKLHNSMNLAYVLLFILFAAWHISYWPVEDIPNPVTALPSLIASLSLLIRIFGNIGYRLYFHFFPLQAMR